MVVFESLIESGKVSDEKCRLLLAKLISDKYLLCGLGEECDDSVFTRSFSVYYIGAIIEHNRKAGGRILDNDEVRNILCAALEYYSGEKDLRHFVEMKGWAHSAAHGADFRLFSKRQRNWA